ncbi:MAG: hypothetical protein JWO77_3776 [Ilumatobacteraceae bacterium]|nr:hypothetical protein [Ilumatobacteraceae bacterium]
MSDTPPPTPPDLPASWQEDDDDAIRADKRGRLWWVLGGIVLVVLLAAGVFAFVQALQPEDRAWPEAYGGRPQGLGGEKDTAIDVTPKAPPGVYIWQSFDGWHLWLVNGDGFAGLTGTISSSDDVVEATSSSPGDGVVTAEGRTVSFDLSDGAPVAGVDFDPGFANKLTFNLESGGGEVEATQVFTGSDSAPVDAVPVVVDKAPVD